MRVVLITMPWTRTDTPSIQCGTLQAIAERAGHEVSTRYLNLELAGVLGVEVYTAISGARAERLHLFGEWLFGAAAFDASDDGAEYLSDFPELRDLLSDVHLDWSAALEMRSITLPAWIAQIACEPDWGSVDVVGFSSTFFQNVATLSLARALAQRWSDMHVMVGGANFDGDMGTEYMRHFGFIDSCVTGEGDRAFPEALDAIAHSRSLSDVAGVVSRASDGALVVCPPRQPIETLDEVPAPQYRDYFETVSRIGRQRVMGDASIALLMEFSRGCWWGQKHHCVFCGLNSLGMQFRSKSAAVALEQLSQLLQRHKVQRVDAVDNIIDTKYLRSFIANVADSGWDLDLFFEVKANMTRPQVQALASGGVKRIQPGIESLSTAVLDLMRKGSTKLINLRLLKWARFYGIGVSWNILAGFPGETDAAYQEQLELMPHLYHLEPPTGAGRIWLERFSPYFTDPPPEFDSIRPRGAYQHVYPVEGLNLSAIAYFFDHGAIATVSEGKLIELQEEIKRWRETWASRNRPELRSARGPGYLHILDTRHGHARQVTVDGWRAAVLDAINDTYRSIGRLYDELGLKSLGVSGAQLDKWAGVLQSSGLAVGDRDQILGLIVPSRSASQLGTGLD